MRRERSNSGASLVEFSLTVSLALVALFTVMEFGQAMFAYHFVASAARQASRYAIVRGAQCTSFTSACPASSSDLTSYVASITPAGINSAQETVTSSWSPDNSPGSTVTVTVQYSFDLDIPFITNLTLPLKSQAQMVVSQ